MNFRQGHHRRSIRLPEYDYSQAGAYYVAMCTRQKALLFGELREGVMIPSPYGRIAEEEWQRSARIRSEVQLDAYVIMPNHMHAVVFIVRDLTAQVPSNMAITPAHAWTGTGDRPVAPTLEAERSRAFLIRGAVSGQAAG